VSYRHSAPSASACPLLHTPATVPTGTGIIPSPARGPRTTDELPRWTDHGWMESEVRHVLSLISKFLVPLDGTVGVRCRYPAYCIITINCIKEMYKRSTASGREFLSKERACPSKGIRRAASALYLVLGQWVAV